MPLFVNTLMLAGVVLAALPVIIHLFFRLRRRRVVMPTLRFLKRTQTVQSARLKLRDLLLLLCRAAAILCLVFAFARPYFIGQQLEAGVESGAVDLVLIVDNSASMSYKPDQLSRLDVAREQALALIALRQTGDRIAVLEATRPNDPVQRLDPVLARAQASVKALPQRLSTDRPLAALITAANSFADDPANKHTHRIVYIGDFQQSRWPTVELQRQVAPLVDKFRVEVNLIDLSGPAPAHVELLKPDAPTARHSDQLSANTTIAAIDFNLTGAAPRQPAPVTVTIHCVDDKPVAVLPVKLTVLPAIQNSTGTHAGTGISSGTATTPPAAQFLGSLTMAGSGDGRVTLTPSFPQAGWQVIKVEVTSRDPLPADDIAYAATPLTERPSVLVVDGAGDDDDVREDDTRGQAYFVTQALQANISDQGRELDVKKVAPSGLTNLALATHGGVVLCGVSTLAPSQVETLEQFVARGGQLCIFTARVKPGIPGKLQPPEDLTNTVFYDTAFYKNGAGLIGVRFDKAAADTENFIVSPHSWDRNSDIFQPFTAADAGDPIAFSLYAQTAVNEQDLQSLLAASAANSNNPAAGATEPARVIAAISPTRPFMLNRPYGAGQVLVVFGAARPEWTNWIRKRNFLPVIRQWSRRLDAHATNATPLQNALATRYFAGAQPTVAQLLNLLPAAATAAPGTPPAKPGIGTATSMPSGPPTAAAAAAAANATANANAHTARYFLQRPDPAEPFAPPPTRANALRVENLTLESTLDFDIPGIYYIGTAATGADAAQTADAALLPIAVSVDPTEGNLQAAEPNEILTALATTTKANAEHHTITAESSDAAKQSSRVWIYLAAVVALLLLIEQLLRDGGAWRRTATTPER